MTTKQLRNKILDLAIHGRLVPQDPNDEPASTLLARIRAEKEQLVKDGKLKKKDLVTTPVSDEDKPFEVPEGWEWCRLSTLVSSDCTLGYGIVQPMDDVPNGVPLVRPVDLVKPIIGKDGLKRVDQSISETYKRTILKGGEILFCVRASVGKVSIASSELCGANVTRGISPIWFDYEILTRYVFYLFQSNTSLKEIKEYAKGATLQQINVEDLKKLLIPLPPLAEQQRIVAAVEQWMSLVDVIESGKENLQQSIALAKNKILDLAIKGELVEKEGEWEEKTLGEVCTFESGLAYSSDKYTPKGTPLIRISNIIDGSISLKNCVFINENDYARHFYVEEGDLLIAMSGATTGKMGIYQGANRAVLNQRVGNIKIKDQTILCAGFRNLVMESLKSIIEEIAYGGAQPNISSKMICALPIPLPPLSEQRRIVAKVEEIFAQLDNIAQALI